MERELFVKYLENRYSEEELEQVLRWFNDEAGTLQGRSFLKTIWKEMADDEDNLDDSAGVMLDRIHHDLNRMESEKLLRESHNNPVRYIRRKKVLSKLSRVAAVLFIPLLAFTILISLNRYVSHDAGSEDTPVLLTKVYSPVGSISQVDLPDGTRVWLNHKTTLIYPVSFSENSRQVELSGEAYFDVTHNPGAPFIVNTNSMTIKAVGTSFNVMAYPDDYRVETTLVNGTVILQKRNNGSGSSSFLEMSPGEFAVYDELSQSLEYGAENLEKYIVWKDGRLVFENDPLKRVAERLRRFYNVEIELKDPVLSDFTYTATFEDETLAQVMELLELATPIDYSISSRHKLANGSFSKRKVVIRYKGN